MHNLEESDIHIPTSSTDFDLLKSKIHAPILRARYVQRMRLVNSLRAAMGCKLTLVVTPAGYGKTTLVREWMAVVNKDNWPVAWISLDRYDNDLHRFWSYVIASMEKIDPVLGQLGQEIVGKQVSSSDVVQLNPLINAISSRPFQFTLVLDDYHVIQEDAIHHSVEYFIENLPTNLHLLIISRVSPPFSLTRLQIRGQLHQLSANDLAFTLEETQAFLSGIMTLNITLEEIASLLNLTDGWIAGLQLFAFSLEGKKSTRVFLDDFTCNHRLILNYLTEEVLNQQSGALKEFLLKTSILDELSVPLCDSVLNRHDSRDLLNQIERANLFITPLDEHGNWYRYHALFADVLKTYLQRAFPMELPELHQRACAWLLNNGYLEKAVPHAIAAGDLNKAAEIIDTFANQAVLQLNITNIIHWIDLLPGELLGQHLGLFWPYAMASYHYGNFAKIEKKIIVIEQEIKRARGDLVSENEKERVHRQAVAIRSAVACVNENFEHGIQLASQVLDDLYSEDQILFGWLKHSLGYAYILAGDPNNAVDSFRAAYQIALNQGLHLEYVYSRSELARVKKMQGCLHDAQKEYNQALSYALEKGLNQEMIFLPQAGLGELQLEWNDLLGALKLLHPIIDYFLTSDLRNLSWVYTVSMCSKLAKYSLVTGNVQVAVDLFQKAWRNNQDLQISSRLVPEITDVMARIWLATGELASAETWADAREVYLECQTNHLSMVEQITMTRIFLATNQPQKALVLLKCLSKDSNAVFWAEERLEISILRALTQYSLKDEEKALYEIKAILKVTEPEGYIGIFRAEGEKMGALLSKLKGKLQQNRGIPDDTLPSEKYIGKLCNAFINNSSRVPLQKIGTSSLPKVVTPLTESLSNREIEVLGLLIEGKTVRDVAEKLIISNNTVKAHVKNIYQKLNVNNRREAIQRALELDILTH